MRTGVFTTLVCVGWMWGSLGGSAWAQSSAGQDKEGSVQPSGQGEGGPGSRRGIVRLPPGERPGVPGRPIPGEVARGLAKALGAGGDVRLHEVRDLQRAHEEHLRTAQREDHSHGEHHVNWFFLAREGEEQPFLATVFNFLVLVLLFARFGVAPLREYVRARHERIARELAEASRLKNEAESQFQGWRERLAHIDEEIARLLRELRAEGETERDRIITEAEEQARRFREEAEAAVGREMRRVRKEVEREVVLAAVATAEKMLKERLTEADQRMLIERGLVALSAIDSAPKETPRGTA